MLANQSFSGSVFSPACLLGQSRLGVRCRHHHGFSKVVISQPRLRGCLGFSRNVIPWLPRQNGDPGQLQPQPSFSPPRLATSLSVASQGIADPQEAEPAVYSQLPTAWNKHSILFSVVLFWISWLQQTRCPFYTNQEPSLPPLCCPNRSEQDIRLPSIGW